MLASRLEIAKLTVNWTGHLALSFCKAQGYGPRNSEHRIPRTVSRKGFPCLDRERESLLCCRLDTWEPVPSFRCPLFTYPPLRSPDRGAGRRRRAPLEQFSRGKNFDLSHIEFAFFPGILPNEVSVKTPPQYNPSAGISNTDVIMRGFATYKKIRIGDITIWQGMSPLGRGRFRATIVRSQRSTRLGG